MFFFFPEIFSFPIYIIYRRIIAKMKTAKMSRKQAVLFYNKLHKSTKLIILNIKINLFCMNHEICTMWKNIHN